MEPSETVKPPRVAQSPASIECTLHSTLELGDSTVVFGSVVAISVADEVLVDGHPEYDRCSTRWPGSARTSGACTRRSRR